MSSACTSTDRPLELEMLHLSPEALFRYDRHAAYRERGIVSLEPKTRPTV